MRIFWIFFVHCGFQNICQTYCKLYRPPWYPHYRRYSLPEYWSHWGWGPTQAGCSCRTAWLYIRLFWRTFLWSPGATNPPSFLQKWKFDIIFSHREFSNGEKIAIIIYPKPWRFLRFLFSRKKQLLMNSLHCTVRQNYLFRVKKSNFMHRLENCEFEFWCLNSRFF